jgi:hypothetical protein
VKCATTAGAVDAGAAAREWVFAGLAHGSPTRKLHERLHTHRTFDDEQVRLNEKAPISGAFAEPSSGLEPETPPYHRLHSPLSNLTTLSCGLRGTFRSYCV